MTWHHFRVAWLIVFGGLALAAGFAGYRMAYVIMAVAVAGDVPEFMRSRSWVTTRGD